MMAKPYLRETMIEYLSNPNNVEFFEKCLSQPNKFGGYKNNNR
jgi:hypothetical protein